MSSSDESTIQEVEAAKRASVAQLLFKCSRLFNAQALDRVRALTGHEGLRPAHTAVFAHIDFEGTRLTEIARRMEISKQAVGQLVADLEAMEVIERVPDPTDGRARLIRFSATGQRGLLHGLNVLREMEDELGAIIGAEHMRALHAALLLMHDELERRQGS